MNLTWARLSDAVLALDERPGVTVGRIELGELRARETPHGIEVHIEDLLAIAREQATCGPTCRSMECRSTPCTERRIARAFASSGRMSRLEKELARRRRAPEDQRRACPFCTGPMSVAAVACARCRPELNRLDQPPAGEDAPSSPAGAGGYVIAELP